MTKSLDCLIQEMKEPMWLAKALGEQLGSQSDYCSLMGSSLGNILWDLSKCPYLAGKIATNDHVDDLFETIRCGILCYIKACKQNTQQHNIWPAGLSANETRFAISLAGLAANIAAACPSTVLTCGRKLLKDIINSLIDVDAEPLNKILLELLYNVSLDEVGAMKLQDKQVMQSITKGLKLTPEVVLASLKLLASLTARHIPNTLLTQMPIERVRYLYHYGDTEMNHYASMILRKVEPLLEVKQDKVENNHCKQILNKNHQEDYIC